MNSCPNCQAELKPEAKFCPSCGQSVAFNLASLTAEPAATYTAQPYSTNQSTQAYACPNCGAALGAGAAFCGSCGVTIGGMRRKTKVLIASAVVGLALIVGAVFYFFSSSGKGGSGLFPIVQSGRWGYMNKQGKVVINPQFDEAGLFAEGLAPVRVGRKYGYINTKGEFVINPQFEMAAPFSESLAAVITNDKPDSWKLGYIDKTGKMVITPQFDTRFGPGGEGGWLISFSEGLALVKVSDKVGYIDKTGKFIINPQFDNALPFSEGLAPVMIDRKWGYIDKTGKFIINPQFDRAFPFTEGLGLVRTEDKWGYVDKTGKFVINPQFDAATPFSEEGIAGVAFGNSGPESGRRWGGIDKTGRVVINPQFDGNSLFPGPRIHPGIDEIQSQLIASDIRRITFSEGLACVAVGGKYGYVDKTGKYVINPQFDAAYPFNEGLAMVAVGHRIGYIDKSGKYVWNPTPVIDERGNDNTNTTTSTSNR